MEVQSLRASRPEEQAILAHYQLAAPLIAKNFPNVPVAVTYYPNGLDGEPTFSGAWEELPASISGTRVITRSGEHLYPQCTVNGILWLAHRYAVGIMSWTPSSRDPHGVGCAHIGLRPVAGGAQALLKEAMLALRTALSDVGLGAIPILHGVRGAALFVPFADAPSYEEARAWLHELVNGAITRHPNLLVHEKRPHEQHTAPRIECTVVANAVGHGSLLPYALGGTIDLPMATPIEWNELATIANGDVTAANAAQRLAKGDVYEKQARVLASQRFADAAAR